jgi:hypothetical protein
VMDEAVTPPHRILWGAPADVESGRHGSVLHQMTMGDPGRAPRSPQISEELRAGDCPCPGTPFRP